MKIEESGISNKQILLMAVSAGICVANIYYNQPLLHKMAQDFKVNDESVGITSVMAQAGYGLGLFFLTPLGDKLNRKKLIITLQILLVFALLIMAFAQSVVVLSLASLLIGLLAVSAQVILPLAAYLAKKDKGKIVGIIFTGILTGILSARVFSGFIADWYNWRMVYIVAACMVLLSSIALYSVLPNVPILFQGSYGSLLQSTLKQFGRFHKLRFSAFLGAIVFGVFSCFWTTLTFHLSGPPFQYSTDKIGLLGILAIGGALIAPYIGKLADKRNPLYTQITAVIVLGISLAVGWMWQEYIFAILFTVFFLDLSVQSVQVTNVSVIYTLDENAHSRINTIYMTLYFLGGAFGTFIGIKAWKIGGWFGVNVEMAVMCTIAFLLIVFNIFRKSRR